MKLVKDCTLIGIEGVEKRIPQFLKAADICQHYIGFENVKLLSPYNLKSKEWKRIKPMKDREMYCKFVIKELHKFVDTSHFLLFQNDGWILNPDAWDDDFLNYDYIGAPWHWDEYPQGNGGFTLRSKSFMEECSRIIINQYEPEDLVICTKYKPYLEKKGFKFAPREVAERFSLEKNARYTDKWNGQFGFHDIEKTDISDWKPPKKEFNLDWDQFAMQVASKGKKYNEYPPTINASALKLSKDERKRL